MGGAKSRGLVGGLSSQAGWLLWVCLVCLVCLVEQDQLDELNKSIKPDRPIEQDKLENCLSLLPG